MNLRAIVPGRGPCVLLILSSLIAFPVLAEETVGKWRVEFKIGGINPGDNIRSQAANAQIVIGQSGDRITVGDPRPNEFSSIEGRLASDPRMDLRFAYGLKSFKTSELVLDFGIGYYTTRINNLEFFYSLDVQDPNYQDSQSCATELYATGSTSQDCVAMEADSSGQSILDETWIYQPINAGDVTQIPVSIGVYQRFRPTKRFNPYLGVAAGYLFVELEESDEWRTFADQMDASFVDYTVKAEFTPSRLGIRSLAGQAHDLVRPRIEAEDGPFVEVRGGFEWQWRRNTAFFVETSFFWAQKNIVITVDGQEQFGAAVTDGVIVNDGSPDAFPIGGLPAYVICGGVQPGDDVNVRPGTLCPGAGEYFFNGGTLDHGGFSWQAGIRFTL